MRVSSFARSALVIAAAAMTMTACSSTAEETTSDAPSASAGAAALETITPGKLTIATGEPAYEPWVIGDAPESGEGFEAAIAYAVAAELGFAAEDVVWVRSTFDSAIAPGPKDWDFNLQQFSITEERKAAVDFSSAYYTTSQAIITVEGSAAATATLSRRTQSRIWRAPPRTRSLLRSLVKTTSRCSTPLKTPCSHFSLARSTASSLTCQPPSTSPL